MLQTETSWEIEDDTRIVRALTGDPTKRRYHLIELALNVPIYRLDVVMPGPNGGDPILRRFRFDNLHTALGFIQHKTPLLMKLIQEPAFAIDKQSELREIHAVFSGVDEDGLEVYVINTDKGVFRVGGVVERESDALPGIKSVWVCAAHLNHNLTSIAQLQ